MLKWVNQEEVAGEIICFTTYFSKFEGHRTAQGEGGAGGETDVGHRLGVSRNQGLGGELGLAPFGVEKVFDREPESELLPGEGTADVDDEIW